MKRNVLNTERQNVLHTVNPDDEEVVEHETVLLNPRGGDKGRGRGKGICFARDAAAVYKAQRRSTTKSTYSTSLPDIFSFRTPSLALSLTFSFFFQFLGSCIWASSTC